MLCCRRVFKASVLSLWIYYLMGLTLVCGGSVIGHCFVTDYLVSISSFVIEGAGCFTLIVFLMFCDC